MAGNVVLGILIQRHWRPQPLLQSRHPRQLGAMGMATEMEMEMETEMGPLSPWSFR